MAQEKAVYFERVTEIFSKAKYGATRAEVKASSLIDPLMRSLDAVERGLDSVSAVDVLGQHLSSVMAFCDLQYAGSGEAFERDAHQLWAAV